MNLRQREDQRKEAKIEIKSGFFAVVKERSSDPI